MAQPHPQLGEVVSVAPLGAALTEARTTALLKAAQMEVMRVVLLAGHEMKEHQAPGETTVQCIEGEVDLRIDGRSLTMRAGDWVHLRPREPHALRALADSSLLVTLCLAPGP